MPFLISLADARDVVIIVYGIIGVIFFFVGLIVLLVVGLTVRGLLKNVQGLLNETVRPTVDSIKNAADTMRGTTEFVGRTAVSPIVRTYGLVAGVRKGVGVFSGLARRGK
jgi:hypothetical protein